MHLLFSAYACRPNSGSEEGNGWGWPTHLAARGLRVHVLTAGKHREAIEAELQKNPMPNLSFSFVEPRRKGLKYGHGSHYLAWQFAAVEAARKLNAEDPFDVVHHITYGSIHVPSQLWRLGIPVVFGPVGGGQTSPFALRSYFGASQRNELLRTAFTKALRFSPLHRRWIKRMAVVFATNQETLLLAQQLGKKDAVLALDVGLPETFLAERPRQFAQRPGPVRLLWTGRMMPRKALPLTLDALCQTKADVTLTILGSGYPAEVVHEMIAGRGLESKVTWSGGAVPWQQVREAYLTHDAFLFTSLRDSCAAQLLEAMALGLPVITLDLHGGGLLTPPSAGYKVRVTDKESTIRAIARAIETFASSSIEEKNAMSEAGWNAARNLTFEVRAARAESLYKRILEAREIDQRSRPGKLSIPNVTSI